MKRFFLGLLAVLAVVIAGILVFNPHIRTALIYFTADIDDYTLFENRNIEAGAHQPWKLAADYNTQTLADSSLQLLEEFNSVAYLVVQGGEVKFEKYWEGYDENSLSNSFSVAKSIVSLLIGAAIDEGLIESVEQPVGDFLPGFKGGMNDSLNIRDLLTMQSGLNWDENYMNPFSMTTRAYYGTDLPAVMEDMEVVEPTGVEFKYVSGATLLLGQIVAKATGMTLSEYASQKLWKPLGAKNTALWSLDQPNGIEKAYCCFNSNARDFARLGQLMLDSGNWKGQQLISKAYISEATAPAILYVYPDDTTEPCYGYQIWLMEHEGMLIPYFRGILGQYIFIVPEYDAVIVRLGHKRNGDRKGMHTLDTYDYLRVGLSMLEKRQRPVASSEPGLLQRKEGSQDSTQQQAPAAASQP